MPAQPGEPQQANISQTGSWVAETAIADPAARRNAASTAFDNSMAMVIGPNPPGTGVIPLRKVVDVLKRIG